MLFSADHIIPRLKATERFGVIREMIAHLVHVGKIQPEDEEKVVSRVTRMEKEFTTAECGVAIPSIQRSDPDAAAESILALGIAPSGVDWQSLDEQPVYIVLMRIYGPRLVRTKDFQSARRILKLIRSRVREQLLRLNSAAEIWSVLKPDYERWASLLDRYGAHVSTGEVCVDKAKGLAWFYPDQAILGDRAATLVTGDGEHYPVAACGRCPERPFELCYELKLHQMGMPVVGGGEH